MARMLHSRRRESKAKVAVIAVAAVVLAAFSVAPSASAASPYSLFLSQSSSRSAPVALAGATVSGSIFVFLGPTSGVVQVRFYLDNTTASGTPIQTEKHAAYDLAGTASNGSALPYSTSALAAGSHTITAAVDKSAGGTDISTAQFSVGAPPPPPPPGSGSDPCSPLGCTKMRVTVPYVLDYQSAEGGIADKVANGTGFTTYLRTKTLDGYVPSALTVDSAAHRLSVVTSAGTVLGAANSQDNALGVGFTGQTPTVLQTVLSSLPTGSTLQKQAGVWFGYSQDEVARLGVVMVTGGWRFEYTLESGGVVTSTQTSKVLSISSSSAVSMRITTDPSTETATATYRIGTSGSYTSLGPPVTIPGLFFSFDGAGIDPAIGTRSFSGIWASSMVAGSAPTFGFSSFSVIAVATPPPPPPTGGAMSFTRTSFALPYPTAMEQGPDGNLYVTTISGAIHILTLGSNGGVSNDQKVTTLGYRLALGITIDPASTPSNVIVWVAHSSPAVQGGDANSGMVTRLSGPGLTTRQDVITGLPRSIANHSVNGLKFGADKKLYIAVGGNTGAGAHNTANTEFGTRAEQALSAAVVVADVNNSTFDGTCADSNLYITTAPCDVRTFATGLRNTYDIVWHSNGHLYGPDNGLGVVGSYPPTPTAPCTGPGSTTAYTSGGNNPGDQPDELNLIEAGRYYGHPDPVRSECVFSDGHFQKVSPASNYTAPTASLGLNQSPDGIVEYTGNAFCGALKGNLLVTDYSQGKDVKRLILSADGRSVVKQEILLQNFKDPLPIATLADGRMVVGELGGGVLTFLTPQNTGCYSSKAALPTAILDAGGVAIGSTLYVVGGKTAPSPGQHQNTLYGYDSVADTWTPLPPKTGTPVENPAVAAYNGKLYVAGGSTGPFSGAVREFRVYDPVAKSWTSLPPMALARGGAGAAVIGSTLYVVGGMDGSGASLASVEKIDLANPTSWTSAPSMSTARDNPGVVSIGTSLYAFGGRVRLANGSTVNGVLTSTESLAPGASSWSAKAPMPTGRRTMAALVVNGRAYALGGEITSSGGAFTAAEAYDPLTNTWAVLRPMPVGRHGMAAGVINNEIHLIGGGTVGGTSFSTLHTVFTP